jgi:hypothetical protein
MTVPPTDLTPTVGVGGPRVGGSPTQLLRAGDPVALRHELGATALLVLRARQGLIAIPVVLHEPAARRAVLAVASDLRPIRTRAALLDSYGREAVRSETVRFGYALAWLDLGHGGPAAAIRRRGRRGRLVLVRGRC